MRCPDCNRFVSFEEQEPEINEMALHEDGLVKCEVRIVNACQDCGTELTESQVDLEYDAGDDIETHKIECLHREAWEVKEDYDGIEIVEEGAERENRTEGKGRGMRTYYGATVTFSLKCPLCGENIVESHSMSGDVQASDMQEMV